MRNDRWFFQSKESYSTDKDSKDNDKEYIDVNELPYGEQEIEHYEDEDSDYDSIEEYMDKGVYTLNNLKDNLFSDGFLDYVDGLDIFSGDEPLGKLSLAPIVESGVTIIGISDKDADDETLARVTRNLHTEAKHIKPLYIYNGGAIGDTKDIAQMIYNLSKGYKLSSIKNYSQKELDDMGLKLGQLYLSSITTKDLELVDYKKAQEIIDDILEYYELTDSVKKFLEELVTVSDNIKDTDDYMVYAPLLGKIVGTPRYIMYNIGGV